MIPFSGSPRAVASTPIGPFSPECLAQLVFGAFKRSLARFRQIVTGAVDVEVQHRHRRPEGAALAVGAGFGRTLERLRNFLRTRLPENIFLKVHGVTVLSHLRRPFAARPGFCCPLGCRCHPGWPFLAVLAERTVVPFLEPRRSRAKVNSA